jgi:subtilisin family serine protease
VDVVAPGVQITSAWLNGGVKSISGTSMAAPHVAGAAAVYLGSRTAAAPDEVASWIGDQAVGVVVGAESSGTPNLLLNLGSSAG